MFRRPFLRRRRVIGAAMFGGLGYLIGRRVTNDAPPADTGEIGVGDRLAELDRIHRAGTITDAEYESKKAELLKEL